MCMCTVSSSLHTAWHGTISDVSTVLERTVESYVSYTLGIIVSSAVPMLSSQERLQCVNGTRSRESGCIVKFTVRIGQLVTVLFCYSPAYLASVKVTAPPPNMDVLEGDQVKITIGYRGNPKPTVTWYHNNIELVAPATQDSDPVALMGSHSLVLDVVMETNGGTYRAELVNSYGSDVVTVSLNVSGEW